MKHETVQAPVAPGVVDVGRRARLAFVPELSDSAIERWEAEGGRVGAPSRSTGSIAPAVVHIGQAFPHRWARRSPLKFLLVLALTGVAA